MKRVLGIMMMCLFLNTSCGDNRPVLFTMDIEAEFMIPPGLDNIFTHHFVIENVPTFASEYLSGRDKNNIEEIVGLKATLSSVNQVVNWGIVQEVTIHAVSRTDGNDRREVFFQDQIPFNKTEDLDLFASIPDVKDIVLEDNCHLDIGITFRSFVPTEIRTRVFLKLNAYGQ